MTEPKYELGKKYKDTLSGFEGTAIAVIKYITGCIQYELKAYGLHEGVPLKAQWFDEIRLEQVDESETVLPEGPNGGPADHPPAPSRPSL